MIQRTRWVILAAVLGVIAISCGGGAGGAATVTMAEFSMDVTGAVEDGEVVFTVNNEGDFAHEMAVFRTDLAADALPQDADGGVDEGQLEAIGRTEVFDPGTETLTLDLEAGSYALVCNIVFVPDEGDAIAHYDRGMTTTFTVGG